MLVLRVWAPDEKDVHLRKAIVMTVSGVLIFGAVAMWATGVWASSDALIPMAAIIAINSAAVLSDRFK